MFLFSFFMKREHFTTIYEINLSEFSVLTLNKKSSLSEIIHRILKSEYINGAVTIHQTKEFKFHLITQHADSFSYKFLINER